MDFLKKNKIVAGVIVIVVVVAVAGAGFFLMRSKGTQTNTPPGDQTQNIKKLSPEDIGLALSLSTDKRAVEMEVSKLTGIKSIEYEVSYDAEAPPDTSGDEGSVGGSIPRGVVASPIEVKPGQSVIKKEVLLGTCSSNVCKYDKVTSDIKFLVKVNFTSGEVGSVDASLPIESSQ